MKQLIKKGTQELFSDPRLLCLFLAAGMEFLLMSLRSFTFYFQDHFTLIPCVLFLGVLLAQKPAPAVRRQLLQGAAVALWFALIQGLHFSMGAEPRTPGLFFVIYLLAFPFASGAKDAHRQAGLKIVGSFYLLAGLALAFFTGLLALDLLPTTLEPHIYWDGARLAAMWHPNMTANILMVGIGFCLYFFALQKKWIYRVLFFALAALLFGIMALTNSRTAILTTCILVGGFLFFAIWTRGTKRFTIGAIAAVCILVLLFTLTVVLFSLHRYQLIQTYLSQPGADVSPVIVDQQTGQLGLYTHASQNSLMEDIGTLNSRTDIWKAAFRAILEDPAILLRGTPDIGGVITAQYIMLVPHSHNSWMETLLGLGIPGLLIALLFSVSAIRCSLRILFSHRYSLSQKAIAMLVVCLMISGIPEPYLFYSNEYFQCANFAFFLCLGYLIQWTGEAAPFGETPEA